MVRTSTGLPRRTFVRITAVLLALLGVVPMANLITPGGGLSWWGEAVGQWVAWNSLVMAAALSLGYLFPLRTERLVQIAGTHLMRISPRVFQQATALLAVLLSIYAGWRTFHLQPVVGDEFVQRWQAHLISHGRLTAQPETHGEFFSGVEALTTNGKWFAQFPMGWPAFLAIGELVGAPWIVNPMLAGVAVLAMYHASRAIAGEITARIAALLLATCPFVVFMSGSQMNHTASLALLWIAVAAVTRWHSSTEAGSAMRWAVVVGVATGIAATIRPFDAMVFALCIGVFQLHAVASRPRLRGSLVAQLVAGAAPIALLLAANWQTVGAPFTFAYDALNGAEHRPGFHMTPQGFEHTPRRALYMASAYLMKLDVGLFAWPVPAVLLLVAAFLLLRRATAYDNLLAATTLGTVIGYAAYWSESYFVGPRFLFVIVPVFVLYTARLPFLAIEHIRDQRLRAACMLVVPLWLLVAWLVPGSDRQLVGVQELARIYRTEPRAQAIDQTVRDTKISNAVVFISEGLHSRLSARLRALGMRPLAAEQLVMHADACTIVDGLNAFDNGGAPEITLDRILDRVGNDPVAAYLPELAPNAQISLIPARGISAACQLELNDVGGSGASLEEMMPLQEFDAAGRLAGSVIYARDFGARNELLRSRFGDRTWYVAHYSVVRGKPSVVLVRM